MKKLFIILTLFFAIKANAQQWQWLTSPNPVTGGMTYQGMDIDADANVYTIGQFLHDATFGTTTLQSSGNLSLYFAKQTPNGNFVFAKRIWTNESIGTSVIKTDAAGNSYIFGTCTGNTLHIGTTDSLVFNIGTGPANPSIFYILKMSKDGNLLWAKKGEAASSLYANARAITILRNNIFISGDYYGNALFLGQAFPTVTSNSCFLLKLDENGNGIWMKRSINQTMVFPTALATDGTSIFVSGKFQNTITIDGVTITNPLATTGGGERVFLFKLDDEGTAIWGKEEGGIANYITTGADANNPNTLVCDASGNLYMGGSYQDDSGSIQNQIQKPFISKYNISTGTKLWTVTYAAAGNNAINGLAVDSNQDVIGVGEYIGAMSLDTFNLPTDTSMSKGMVFRLNKTNGACTNVIPIGLDGYLTNAQQIVMNKDHSSYYVGGVFRTYTHIDTFTIFSNVSSNTSFNAKYNFGPPTSSIRNPVAAQFSLYPNPANDQLIVALKSPEEGTVFIFNSMGQQVYQQSVHGIRTQLNIAQLPAGNYFLKGIFGEHSASRRFTKY